jgi:hypothetical protein
MRIATITPNAKALYCAELPDIARIDLEAIAAAPSERQVELTQMIIADRKAGRPRTAGATDVVEQLAGDADKVAAQNGDVDRAKAVEPAVPIPPAPQTEEQSVRVGDEGPDADIDQPPSAVQTGASAGQTTSGVGSKRIRTLGRSAAPRAADMPSSPENTSSNPDQSGIALTPDEERTASPLCGLISLDNLVLLAGILDTIVDDELNLKVMANEMRRRAIKEAA